MTHETLNKELTIAGDKSKEVLSLSSSITEHRSLEMTDSKYMEVLTHQQSGKFLTFTYLPKSSTEKWDAQTHDFKCKYEQLTNARYQHIRNLTH